MANQATVAYQEEQAKLQREHDGESDINIDVPQLPEVNPEIFRDVRPLLTRGFLHVRADINGVPVVFKSVNHHEFELIQFHSVGKLDRKALRQLHNIFLAYGVLMVDGINVLSDRDHWIPEIAKMFEGLTEGVRQRVVFQMSEINRRADQACVLTEAYTMETESRLRWAQMRGLDITCTASTGMRGTDLLGMNWGQLTWRALNYFEDHKETAEREWENAKFVASSMAGKGMSKIHAQDRRRREQERDDRFERRDKVIRLAVFGEDPESTTADGAVVTVARTVEELSDQLEKDLRGEKDWHDGVVEAHEHRVRDQHRQRAAYIQSLQDRHQKAFGERSLVGSTDLKGLTPQEVQFRVERRRQITAQRLSAQQVYPELHDPKMAEFAQKWGHNQLPVSNRDPSEVAPVVVADRPRSVPFKRGGS